ncbi:hypothetical protein CTA2_6624 [Colletotrichum tanaceti]|uniref:Uncharacterized protein n=1 Tax=Colletotrichum tanaceti TaxID=1306861 RepID=A0A4U6X9L1_9PEZI|nr:hypothetical protein CTA2_6624 [Colletotrichum tanaceti]TKW52310.1 hypothetical protein CTA1_3087 [Colletotrichum tanaceti]
MSAIENQHGAYGSFGSANDRDLVKKVNEFNESKIAHDKDEPSSAETKAATPTLGSSSDNGEVQAAGRQVSEKFGEMANKKK